jgi:dihydrofolate reductase
VSAATAYMRVNLIGAVAKNGVIGGNNRMPWRLPVDFAWFRRHTLGHPVVMGRKTFESIGKPLPGRRNLVVTRNPHWAVAGAERAESLDHALESCRDASEVFVIGGAELYRQALPRAERLILTFVDAAPAGDTVFPQWNREEWSERSRERHAADEANAYSMEFVVLHRIPANLPA